MLSYPFCNLSLLVASFVVLVAAKILAHIISNRVALRHVPGPKSPSKLWGQEWVLYNSIPGLLYLQWHIRYGKVVKFSGALGHPILSITDPRAISFILGEGAYNFPKPYGVRAWFKALLGEGILWVEGKAAHEEQRKIIAPALSAQAVRGLVPIIIETSSKLGSQWSYLFDSSGATSIEIDIMDWAGRFALDTVARAAFSYDLGCLTGDPHSLTETFNDLTNNEDRLSSFYMRALFWLFPPILMIGKKGRNIRRVRSELGKIGALMWRDAKMVGDTGDNTLLAHMLRADQLSVAKMDEEQVLAQMRTTVSAGYETVSAVISWLLYELAKHPEFQSILRTEVTEAGEISSNMLSKGYRLLDAAIKETLRLHPPILENHHEAAHTVTIPLVEPLPGASSSHLTIPKGTVLSIPVNVIQLDPSMWGDDAKSFRPERWLDQGSNIRRNLLAFSEGPRSCIGKTFALTEIKILVATLLRHFSFSCNHDIEAFQSFVIRPRVKGERSSSLPLRVRRV
ncbi:cytochrome P450 [Amanita rubescens]|nr:cytochrome P450 [Amanita rubescens]